MIVIASIAAITLLAWVHIVSLAGSMPGIGMPDMPGMDMAQPAIGQWRVSDFVLMFAMWAVMMVGMMLPSVTPMVLVYARVARQASGQGEPFAATAWFVGGYLLAWIGFSLIVTVAQWALAAALLLTPAMSSASKTFGAIILIAAGVYQWTPLKEFCLAQCQTPLLFLQRHGGFQRSSAGSLRLGARHGLYCIGCCWVLMALLFVVGVMNLLWIAALASFILLEKIIPAGRLMSRLAGACLVLIGIALSAGLF
jgi:predicted metal-binding membrane protein